MQTSPTAARSVDTLTPLSPKSRHEIPFHSRQGHPRPTSRRGSTASSLHSVGGALDTPGGGRNSSGFFESGQNAISTLLQPPIVRTGHQQAAAPPGHKPPTARDIPPVTLTNVPPVDSGDFSQYVAQVGALYQQLRRVREQDDENAGLRKPQDEQPDDASDVHLRPGFKRRTRKGSTTSLSSLTSLEAPSPVRRSSSNFRKAQQGPPPLSTIPPVYFQENFHLEDPRTFDVVSELSEVIPSSNPGDENDGPAVAPRKALATNAILQEKLSWYMDTVEVHLINSISTASTTFFTALGSLKELHSEAADSVRRIKALRNELEVLDQEVAERGLETAQKQRRQENLAQLNDAVAQLRRIIEGVSSCETLVDEGEVDKALVSIDQLEKLIAGEREEKGEGQGTPNHLRDLRGAAVLSGVHADLSTLRFRVGKAYESQFSEVLIADLRRHVETVAHPDVLLRWGNAASRARGAHLRSPSIFPSYLTATEELKTKLLPTMVGLNRAQHVATAAMSFREAALREIRNLVRRPLPSSSDDDNESMMSVSTAGGGQRLSNQEKSSILARNLRALEPEDAEEMLRKIYVGVAETLRRLSTQVKVLLDIASSLSSDGIKSPRSRSPIPSPRLDRPPNTPQPGEPQELQEELHRTLDISNLLGQAVDIANDKIVKVLKVRGEQAAHMPLDLFLRYFTLNLYFANECEAISGRSGTSLKTVVNGHIKTFVEKNRDTEMQKLAQGMDPDQWTAADFTEHHNEVLRQVLQSSTQDAEAWTERLKLWVPYHETHGAQDAAAAAAPESGGTGKDKARMAQIDEDKFILPNSALLCLGGIANFLQLMAGIPSMTTDIASSLLSYIQLFNSRCTQLILGAGATRSAGLKNITTKHLALASQALLFTATLIPHIRESVRRHAGSSAGGVGPLISEFDKVRRLLQEHQDSIHQKLVEIMGGRATLHAKAMNAIQWDEGTGKGSHGYMETLVKETTTLHKVLTKHLPEGTVRSIMGPVFESYKDHLGKALTNASPRTGAGKQSMLADLDLFSAKLGKINGFGDVGDHLVGIVNAKEVEAPKETPPAAAANADAEKTDGEETAQRGKSSEESGEKKSEEKSEGSA